MNLVIDASVAIKWFLAENLHAEARRLLDGDDILHAPDLLPVEMANAAWKKAKRKEIDGGQAKAIALAHLRGVPELRPSADLIDRALQMALELDHPVHDCVYLACAEAVGGIVATADKRFQDAVRASEWSRLIRHLSEFRAT